MTKHQTFSSLCLFIPPHPSHILERFKKGRPNIPKQQRPSSKGKTLIQRDCSIGDFLLVKKKNEQKPLFFRKKTKTKKQPQTTHNMETKLRSALRPIMGADTILPRLHGPQTNCSGSVRNNTGTAGGVTEHSNSCRRC